MNNPIQVTQPSLPSFQEYTDEIQGLWDSKWLTNMGEKHKKLELELMNFLNTPNISLFSNGHLALENAIAALELTGEVITTPLTFASTTHAIIRSGLNPIFCDINCDDYTIEVEQIESLITENTSAILPVHVYGNICNFSEINRIAKKYNLKVIYDAAHAFGITVDGVNVANLGDASMFSFHATKVFNTIEGGAVTYKNSNLTKILNALKNFGITEFESVDYVGGNAKMNEFQAAMGLCNLRNIKTEIQKREKVYERYVVNLSGVKGIKLPSIQRGVKSNYAYFPVIFENVSRDAIDFELRKHNIFPRKYFYPLTPRFQYYHKRYNSLHIPNAEYISERVLTLPLFANLTIEEVDQICSIIIAEIKVLR